MFENEHDFAKCNFLHYGQRGLFYVFVDKSITNSREVVGCLHYLHFKEYYTVKFIKFVENCNRTDKVTYYQCF